MIWTAPGASASPTAIGSVAFSIFFTPPHCLILTSAMPEAELEADVAPYGLVPKSESPTSSDSSAALSAHAEDTAAASRRRVPVMEPVVGLLHCEPAGKLKEPVTPLLNAGVL